MRDPWQDAREAWKRLTGRRAGHPLDTLVDIGIMRRALDRAELEAVRSARRAKTSWAEIATRLGITRQSAWERWRDVDEEALTAEPEIETRTVVVPFVVGLTWPVALHRLDEERLRAVRIGVDGPFLGPEAADFVVLDQKPSAGKRVAAGSEVTVWLRRGPGSAGDRAPQPPPPPPRARRGAIEEETGESVR